MIHSKYDLDGALSSAQKAANRTQRPRYVVRNPTGLDIVIKRPARSLYGYKIVLPKEDTNETIYGQNWHEFTRPLRAFTLPSVARRI